MRAWHLALLGALLTAALLAALFPPFNASLLAPLALTPVLYALSHQPYWKHRFLTGWLSGFLYWLVVCHWIRDVLSAYGGLEGPLSWLAVILFAVAKGLHMAVFCTLAGPVLRRRWAIPAIAALWTGIERTHAPLGFPWLALGNAGIDMPLALRLAPMLGVYGLSFLFAALATGLTLAALKRGRRDLAWLLPLPCLFLLPPVGTHTPATDQAVASQINIPADFRPAQQENSALVRQLAIQTLQSALDPSLPKPGLLLWPEAPAPFYYYQDPDFRSSVTELARLASAPMLFSGVAHTPALEPLNSAILLGSDGSLQGRYDKVNLVPFGEYIPTGFGWIQKISSESGNYLPGTEPKVFQAAGHSLAAFICYESAFPHFVRRFANDGAELLVNLTNDGYFGGDAARRQHLMLARMRAVENARWVLRPANDGITTSIDPSGRLWDTAAERQRLVTRLRFGWEHDKTPYTRFGDWFAWLCLAGGLLGVLATEIPVYRP
jgi:apolipoprotein N-acyltransferase